MYLFYMIYLREILYIKMVKYECVCIWKEEVGPRKDIFIIGGDKSYIYVPHQFSEK